MEEIDLKEFLKYLRKYVWMMLVAVFVLVSAISFYDLNIKTKLYKSSTTVVLNSGNSAKTVQEDLTTVNLNQKLVTTYSELVKNRTVLDRTIEGLKACRDDKHACEGYVSGADNSAIEERMKTLANLNLDELSYDSLKSKISVKNIDDTEILQISVEDKNPERAMVLTNEIAHVFENVVEEKFGQKNVKQWDTAIVSDVQSNNTTLRDMAIAAFVGVFGVTAVAFLIFYFDDTVKYSKNLEKELNIPIIGKIAKTDANMKKSGSELLVVNLPKAGTSESIRNLRANLSFSSIDKGMKSLLITSVNPSEGKSFVSSNLASAYALAGHKVLLVDCDLRKGRLHRIFCLKNKSGFSDMLLDGNDEESLKKYIKKTSVKGLSVITRGTCPPNPSELLGSVRAEEVMKKLKKKFDIVILDGAPCGGLADSIVASKLVDAVSVVCWNGKTNRADLMTVLDDLKKVEAPFAGIIVNAIRHSKGSNYYYNYYEEAEEQPKSVVKKAAAALPGNKRKRLA